jgi:hypothetical protein
MHLKMISMSQEFMASRCLSLLATSLSWWDSCLHHWHDDLLGAATETCYLLFNDIVVFLKIQPTLEDPGIYSLQPHMVLSSANSASGMTCSPCLHSCLFCWCTSYITTTKTLFALQVRSGALQGTVFSRVIPGEYIQAGQQGQLKMGGLQAPAGIKVLGMGEGANPLIHYKQY